ncbi:MAG: carbon-nitrogen hydrolase family protein [Chloroflexi bacterium]|nr:carbon-nitrogen hydrolase family protein [Chloroflexota bacterium]
MANLLKATITQLDANQPEAEWERLARHTAVNAPDLVLLPEMCFAPWFCAAPQPDEATWQRAVSSHEAWLGRLPELGARYVIGTAPRDIDGARHNVAYLWSAVDGLQWIHAKTYLPNDEGYWEVNWYDRAPIEFKPTRVGGLTLGVMICTELWFLQHAREYSKIGIHLLLNPRSTPRPTNAKWLAGGRTAAVVSGAYCLSSNHAGRAGRVDLGGAGWLCDPDGAVLATTSEAEPFVTVELDLGAAERAKFTYPRYVDDCPI